ncbi:zinc dependent phospholipase C family protein [Pseudodesulfovibrio sp. zrk46]|uniref:zinc dependent phospholipase C family protein n=1 Tax=Pseudodesulfovibrio sp. zrk46 TaxID=2725288 RepID=UPI001449845B|nr:zinc dependent phospholipase C family protein [Pseudodesulfovibrio sp. zrk46]QJB58116.1 zinc dependent phospholipase C family protein [Pseudodesulfovibrio sp. zrk46]
MPKDLIHFTIAEKTAARLKDTRFAHCFSKLHALLLGSVFHDALFYAAMPKTMPLEKLAHALHGSEAQDTFELLRMQARHAAQAKDKTLPAALLVGMASHIFADVTMHPLVWYFTGDYYADDATAKSMSRQHHRALESLMDMVACPGKLGRSNYRLQVLLRRCPDLITKGLPVANLARAAKVNTEDAQNGIATAWRIYASFQALYPRPMLARILYSLRRSLPRVGAELAMLFYAPQLLRQADRLRGEISFTHPVTGAKRKASLDTLMNEAADHAAALCRNLEATVFDNAPLQLDRPGPSMDTGLVGISTKGMRHFAEPPFPSLD